MTTHLPSEHVDPGSEARLSRRGLVQALAAGAAASVATPALAEPTAVVAEATSADYARDPTRWAAPKSPPCSRDSSISTCAPRAPSSACAMAVRPALAALARLSEQSRVWYAVAARLAERYHVVLADLRGYGDSSLPEPGPNLVNYSFRVMAEDMIEVMENLATRVSSLPATTAARA